MKHILVPTDFSEASAVAFRYIQEELRPRLDAARITLLSVLEDYIPASVQFEFGLTFIDTKGLMEAAEKQAKERIERLKGSFSGVEVSAVVLRAAHPVHTEIINYSKEHLVDLVVMATHGRTGVRRLVLGSVTERVVRESICPVLVVPAHPAHEALTTD